MWFHLFLGFSCDATFESLLKEANPYLVTLFISQEIYLQEIFLEGQRYLGKYLSPLSTIEDLEMQQLHLLSLLKKLTPRYSFSNNPPRLLPIQC